MIFDIGGVLIDWDPRYLYRRLLPDEATVEWFLTEVCPAGWNEEQDRGRSWGEAVAERTACFPEYAELIAAFDERWMEMIAGAIDGSVRVMAELRARGVPLYALTNFSTDKFRELRGRYDFVDWFDGVVVSADERLLKPDPRLYQVLLSRYRLDAGRCVYIDDLPPNVSAARALGMTGVDFTGPGPLRAELAALGLLRE